MNTLVTTLSEKLNGTSREELIAMIATLEANDYNADAYKGKRIPTLANIVFEKVNNDVALYELLSTKGFQQFIKIGVEGTETVAQASEAKKEAIESNETVVETAPEAKKEDSAEKKDKKLRISEMNAKQIIASLTPKQEDVLETVVKNYNKKENFVLSQLIMPEGHLAWAFGGVMTTLIEKGIIEKTGKGVAKKFHITDSFKSILKK